MRVRRERKQIRKHEREKEKLIRKHSYSDSEAVSHNKIYSYFDRSNILTSSFDVGFIRF